jgi:hypothetical protein
VSYPARCRLDCHIEFLPSQAGEDGWGAPVEREFEEWVPIDDLLVAIARIR